MGGQKHSLNLIGPERGQRPPVFFYTRYRFENSNIYIYVGLYIYILYYKDQKIIYGVHTGVDLSIFNMGDASC